MSKERTHPINESWFRSDRIHCNIPFPVWIDDQEIQINLKRTEFLMQLGGIRYLRVEAEKEKRDEPEVIYTMGGVSPDGSITANGILADKQTKVFNSKREHLPNQGVLHNGVWITTELKIDMNLLQNLIIDDGGNLRNSSDWANKIDDIVRSGIRENGTLHLLRGHSKIDKFFAFYILGHSIYMDAADIGLFDLLLSNFNPHAPSINELVNEWAWVASFWTLWSILFNGFESKRGEGYRLSLFPGYEIDRAALLQVLSRRKKVVHYVETSES